MANIELGGDTSTSDIQAVARVGQICALFGPETSELSAADVADRLGLNRTTAYRYCVSLVAAGILDRGPRRGTFVLGGLMLQLGLHALSRRQVIDLAPPHLAELGAAVGLTVVLSLWGARGPVVTLVEEDRSRMVVVTMSPGSELDAGYAQTQLFLAYQAEDRASEWITEHAAPDDRAAIRAGVDAARSAGFAVARHATGVFAAAVPVFDEYGITATIALLGTDPRIDLGAGSAVLDRLLQTAAVLSEELGGARAREDALPRP